jgi:tRNA-(ms[2]io[6]A)-hydroxylase
VTILAAPTPSAWVEAACEHWPELLVDHCNCEKKAASSALSLIFAYPEDAALTSALSRLAREELRHFEQVSQMMRRLGVRFERQRPGRYAAGLRSALRAHEPVRKLDLMCAYALIEARSCERFGLLAARLSAPLGGFYESLQHAEARHFELYVRLAHDTRALAPEQVRARLAQLAAVEAQLATSADDQLRFHSGPPAHSLSTPGRARV